MAGVLWRHAIQVIRLPVVRLAGLGALVRLVNASVEMVASTLTIVVRGDFDLAATIELRNAIRRSAEGGYPDIK